MHNMLDFCIIMHYDEYMEYDVPYKPNKKQFRFHQSGADEVVYGGAKGGGKSCALILDAFSYAVRNQGALIYLFRESFDALESNLIYTWKKMIPGEGVLWKYKSQTHTVEFLKGGSLIRFRYLTSLDDALQYNGREMDYLGIDELTFYDEEWVDIVKSCLRSPKGFHPTFKGTCNPGGRGHAWVKKRYVDGTVKGAKIVKDRKSGNTIEFIPATVRDNTVLMENDPGYIRRLNNLPKAQRDAYLNGNWDIFEGQYFEEFDHDIHVCKPFPIPKEWTRYVAFDYGMDMLAAYDIAIDEQEQAYVLNEIYKPKLIVSEAASLIRSTFKTEPAAYIAPPDLWNRHSDTGRSTAEIFANYGIYLIKSSNNRIQGWNDLREWLKPYKDEQDVMRAKLKIFNTCPNLIRCLPMLQYDDKEPNDCSKNPHEITHAPDAIRYFVSARPMNVQPVINEYEDAYECEVEEFCNFGV